MTVVLLRRHNDCRIKQVKACQSNLTVTIGLRQADKLLPNLLLLIHIQQDLDLGLECI